MESMGPLYGRRFGNPAKGIRRKHRLQAFAGDILGGPCSGARSWRLWAAQPCSAAGGRPAAAGIANGRHHVRNGMNLSANRAPEGRRFSNVMVAECNSAMR
jgi:hypothetical protein